MSDRPPDEVRLHDNDMERATLTHNVAHGLSAILGTIRSARKITEKQRENVDLKEWEKLKRYARVLDHEVTCHFYESLNLLGKLDPTKRDGLRLLRVRRCPPMELLEEMLPGYEGEGEIRDIEIRSSDTTEGAILLELEVTMLRITLHNALANALKYSNPGRPSLKRFIAVRCKPSGTYEGGVCLEFENFGIGIEQSEIAKVWKPGYRGMMARQEATLGSGLGLTQIKKCMKWHNGDATIESIRSQANAPFKTTLRLDFPDSTNVRKRY